MDCLFCNTPLTQKILDLGHSPLANALLNETDFSLPETNYPLQLFVCNHCWLVQLYNRPDPSGIFNEHYAYISSTSKTWQQHCEQFAIEMAPQIDPKGLVVEVGCNDGTLLKHFVKEGLNTLGIDPASMATQLASQLNIPIINDFFNKDLAEKLKKENQLADLLVGNNVLAHVPDINHFVAGISTLLKPNGIATLEVPYLPNLFANAEFDTVYHEHYFYFSLTALQHIFDKHQLQIFDLKPFEIHGGSIRVYLQLKNSGTRKQMPVVLNYFQKEKELGITTPQWYNGLQKQN